jgi:hypothetical protein
MNGQAVNMDTFSKAVKKQIENVITKLPPSWDLPPANEGTPPEAAAAPTVEPDVPTVSCGAVAAIAPAVTDHTLDLEDWKADLSAKMAEACSELSEQDKVELLEFLKATIEGLGLSGALLATPLQEFKNDCDKWLPLMSDDERKKARVYHNQWKPKLQRKAA